MRDGGSKEKGETEGKAMAFYQTRSAKHPVALI
jgi:hypothetical protein